MADEYLNEEDEDRRGARRRQYNDGGGFISVLNRLLIWIFLGLAVAVALEFFGPYKGWFERRFGGEPAETTETTGTAPLPFEELQEIPSRIEDFARTVDGEMVEPEKTPLEKRYDELYSSFLKRLRPPQIGKEYDFLLRNGNKIPGTLEEAHQARVVVGIKFGTMTFEADRIHPRMYPVLFPELTARYLAIREMRREQAAAAEEAARQKAAEIAAVRNTQPPPAPGTTAAAPPPVQPAQDPAAADTVASAKTGPREINLYGAGLDTDKLPPPVKVTYNPAFAPTPARCRRAITSFGQWLNVQHRKLGGKIADKIYAKQHGNAAVLYMLVSEDYLYQNYDLRYRLLESLWGFWGLRCQFSGNVTDPRNAHIVMLNQNGKIIGGSSSHDGSELWVQKDPGPIAQK